MSYRRSREVTRSHQVLLDVTEKALESRRVINLPLGSIGELLGHWKTPGSPMTAKELLQTFGDSLASSESRGITSTNR